MGALLRKRLPEPTDRRGIIELWLRHAVAFAIVRYPVQPSGAFADVRLRFGTLAEAVAVADRFGDSLIYVVRDDFATLPLQREEWRVL